MRLICFLLLSSCLGFAQESDYKSSVIILKDGRMVSIRGDFEIIGDEVQFMYADGNLSTLPLSKIDLEATEKRKEEIEKKIRENEAKAKPKDETVFDEIREYQKEQETKEAQNPRADSPKSQADKPKRRVFEKKEKRKRTVSLDSNPINDLSQEEMERKAEEVVDAFQNASNTAKWVLLGLFVLLLISALVSFVTRIYLIWTAKQSSGFWAAALLLTTAAPFIYGTVGSMIPDESVFKTFLGIIAMILQLIEPIVYGIYIIAYCAGRRLLYLCLYFSPLLVLIGLVIAVIVLQFPIPF